MAGSQERSNFEVLATRQRQLKIALDGKTHLKFNSMFMLCHQQPVLQESSKFCACFNAALPIRLGMNSFLTNNRGRSQ